MSMIRTINGVRIIDEDLVAIRNIAWAKHQNDPDNQIASNMYLVAHILVTSRGHMSYDMLRGFLELVRGEN